MPINFPNSPSPNQQYTYDNKTWEWNGIYWEVYSALTSYVTSTTFNSYTGVTQPLIYSSITGGTYSGGTLYLTNNSGGTISITGFSTSSSGGTISGNYLPLSGGTVTGPTIFTNGLTANTISATTYLNLPTDVFVTGATYSNNTFTYTNNTGGTFNVLFNTFTGLTVNGNLTVTGSTSSGTISATTYLNLPTDVFVTGATYSNNTFTYTNNTGGTYSVLFNTVTGLTVNGNLTVTGNTSVQGLTATTISATTYQNLPTDIRVTGSTYSDNTFTYTNNTGGTFNVLFDNVTGLTVNGNLFVTGTTSSETISASTYQNLPVSGLTEGQDISIIGSNGNFTISFTGNTSGSFTGGTVTGPTNFTSGLTANTISATTYLNLPTTPSHVKIASMSGFFSASTLNAPSISKMYVGNDNIGWSYGDYNTQALVDGFGNLTGIKSIYSNVGIPLPTDLLIGDKIKICGLCYGGGVVEPQPTNETFYVTVSYFTCSKYITGISPSLNTLIPVAAYPFNISRSICFSEEITNNTILPGCTTHLVVGMTVGNDEESQNLYKFSYTLDFTRISSTGGGSNLFIRNCCDPAYSEVIANNGISIGRSFVDTDGNCWSVISETTSDITGFRTSVTEYDNCFSCIDANTCPENFVVQSCCGSGDETFTAALEGITVGSTFVDDFGFCWSVIATTPAPITNVVTIGTIYPSTTCESLECTDANTCPNLLLIVSCCDPTRFGYTTSDILGISVTVGDVFVDTFGICWYVFSDNNVGFPSLNFLSGSTIYGNGGSFCTDCITANSCEINLFYTVQNCCDETIEVVELPAQYNINSVLGLVHNSGAGCYNILSWSDVGTPTLTGVQVDSVYSKEGGGCQTCILDYLDNTCIGQSQCCDSYLAITDSTVTGYLCDGTWVSDQFVSAETSICMAFLYSFVGEVFKDRTNCCLFAVYNPSSTTTLSVNSSRCGQRIPTLTIPPLGTGSTCVTCVEIASGPWEWVACP